MEVEEKVDHLFVQCKVAYQCWVFILQKLNFIMPLSNTLWDMFQDWPRSENHSYYSCIGKCILAIVIWTIWWERNKSIYRNQPSSLESVLSTLEVIVGEVVVAYIKRTLEHLTNT